MDDFCNDFSSIRAIFLQSPINIHATLVAKNSVTTDGKYLTMTVAVL